MRKTLFIIATFITVYSCENTPICSGVISHQVKIVDSTGKAIKLDTFYIICITYPDTLRIKKYIPDSVQNYPLLDDTESSVFKKEKSANFKFIGIKGKDTITSPYTFAYDGCHITLVSGVSKIIH